MLPLSASSYSTRHLPLVASDERMTVAPEELQDQKDLWVELSKIWKKIFRGAKLWMTMETSFERTAESAHRISTQALQVSAASFKTCRDSFQEVGKTS